LFSVFLTLILAIAQIEPFRSSIQIGYLYVIPALTFIVTLFSNVGKYWIDEFGKGRFSLLFTILVGIIVAVFVNSLIFVIYKVNTRFSASTIRFIISNEAVHPWTTTISLEGNVWFHGRSLQLADLRLRLIEANEIGPGRSQFDFVIVHLCRRNPDMGNHFMADKRELIAERMIPIGVRVEKDKLYTSNPANLMINLSRDINPNEDWLCGELHVSIDNIGTRVNGLIPFHSRTFLNGGQNHIYPPR